LLRQLPEPLRSTSSFAWDCSFGFKRIAASTYVVEWPAVLQIVSAKLYSRFCLNARITFEFLQFFHIQRRDSVGILTFLQVFSCSFARLKVHLSLAIHIVDQVL
jgi:hypothetical protein